MSERKPLVFELLNKTHDHTSFTCGVEPLDKYLKTQAGQEFRRNIAFPYIMTFEGEVQVRGVYTLSAASVPLDALPPKLSKLTRYQCVPALLIGRLALDESLHRQGYGQLLLMDALKQIARSGDFAVMIVIVDPKDQPSSAFYSHFGFMSLGDEGGRMFLPFKTIKDL